MRPSSVAGSPAPLEWRRIPSRTGSVRFSRPSPRARRPPAASARCGGSRGRSARAGSGPAPPRRCARTAGARVVPEADRLHEVLVEPQRARHRAGDLRRLQRVREPRAVVVALRRHEHLRLVLEPPERLAVHDPVAVALERRAQRAVLLRARTPGRSARERRQRSSSQRRRRASNGSALACSRHSDAALAIRARSASGHHATDRAQPQVRVVLERLEDRPLGLGAARAATRRAPPPAGGRAPRPGTRAPPPPSGNALASHAAHTTPPAAPENPTRCSRVAAARARRQLRREARREQQLEAERERVGRASRAPARRRAARAGCTSRLKTPWCGSLGLEQPRDRVARARRAVERARVLAQPRMGIDASPPPVTVSSSLRPSWSTSCSAEERLQPTAEARLRAAARPWRSRPAARAAGCTGAGCGRPRRSASSAARSPPSSREPGFHRALAILCEVMKHDHCLHDRALLVLRAREGPARQARHRVRGDQPLEGRRRAAPSSPQRTGMMSFPQVIIGGRAARRLHRARGRRPRRPARRAARRRPDLTRARRPRAAAGSSRRRRSPARRDASSRSASPHSRARLALPPVHEELVLEGAPRRRRRGGSRRSSRPWRRCPPRAPRDRASRSARVLRAREPPAGRSGWMRARNSASSA